MSAPAPDGLLDRGRATVVGPTLASVMQRIAQAPPDCVLVPGSTVPSRAAPVPAASADAATGGRAPERGRVDAAAVVADALAVVAPSTRQSASFLAAVRSLVTGADLVSADQRARAAVLTVWVLLDPGVHATANLAHLDATLDGRAGWALSTLYTVGVALAPALDPVQWPTTSATREESARAILRASGLHPAYETAQSADARWQTVSTAIQRHVLAELAEEARRAEVLARELARKRAREAAAQVSNV
ncbi:hypothetical protein [Sanguibacter antarcticus]|uniref:Uncharacterized protein n=1 Tax=Sanguibacter antarcticus TaxID=372484 RepID=A0A2A9EAC6_9MICO|nr:hypothetical protein [Sanguibacter antarcticus]PFG35225.1 hypothetical protein ATL42_3164 [Sanguibacter antarcticus]